LGEGPPDAKGFSFCSSCGFEFSQDDGAHQATHALRRAKWIAGGCCWFAVSKQPAAFNPRLQLRRIGVSLMPRT
jgi:hypothetical protein